MFGEVAWAASPISTTRPAVEGDLLDRRDVDVGCGVERVEQRRGGVRELREQLAEPLWRAALGCVVGSG
jgi:hypothetical protein